MELLLELKDIDAHKANKYGWTPLGLAAKNGHKHVMELLLQHQYSDNTCCKSLDKEQDVQYQEISTSLEQKDININETPQILTELLGQECLAIQNNLDGI